MDRETVVSWLEGLTEQDWRECYSDSEVQETARQALDLIDELLKEQEAKTGTWQWKIHGKAESGGTLGEAVCDQCMKSTYATAVKGDLNYCPNCGAKMKQEGRRK